MSAKLEFFYDYVSPYSYMANSQLEQLGDFVIDYRPMFLGGVMKATGNQPPGMLLPRLAYMLHDLDRWARHYGIAFRSNSIFPQNTLAALRLALVAKRDGCFDRLHQRLFDAMFIDDRDLSDLAVLREILVAAGLDADAMLAAIEDPDIKAALKTNTEEAVARGAFGAPTMFVGDEMFFGNDRLPFVRAALEASGR
ncbi:MAG: 2-hydroxychromene-2-carboxylate isomerase [Gammaproteobacteria bacterium]|nr:2-hydroxychromene-2-carboxylate isomerase [Gammaproteobacteria bacterium]MDH4253472.1 2-hydroxychromene-2-carboxylate isomerase [Gammaproteobacteria bacterium]MDH5309705.1 2-hydroxychromene-2-carboxylate isomerase [Gammaproteobacteria bacterium]